MQSNHSFERVTAWIHERAGRQVPVDVDLLASGVLDSMAVIELIGTIENARGAKLSAQDLVPENFSSINAIGAKFFPLKER